MTKYDMILVGAGLTSATLAALNPTKRILVLEREKMGGMCRTENRDGIDVHIHGPHIFHTSNPRAWGLVNRFAFFNGYHHTAKIATEGKSLDIPINLSVFHELYGITTPGEAQRMITENNKDSFEEYLIGKIGEHLYNLYYKGYTEKFWGMPAREVPSFIAKRIPIRTNFNNRYFNDRFEGIPDKGYTRMIKRMFSHCEVQYADFISDKEIYESMADVVIYTGSVDEYFGYFLGELPYRSCIYETIRYDMEDHQGIGQMNYPSPKVDYTRSIEHKHFNNTDVKHTFVSLEYPVQWSRDGRTPRFYPIPTEENKRLYQEYLKLPHKAIFAGRLGTYSYLNMDQCIIEAMKLNRTL